MCGICGAVAFNNKSLIEIMCSTLTHRGPDDEGYGCLELESGCLAYFGHKRLSIIDLKSGSQPIYNETGTIGVIFNGEIYNFKETAEFLIKKGHTFKTNTDTETIVHLYEEFGEECIKHIRGMFAFALWDSEQKKIILARDRIGIKPLFYWFNNGKLLFASEIKAILTCSEVKREINFSALHDFLTFMYVPSLETIFKGIYQLEPGHYLIYENNNILLKQYWDINPMGENNGTGKILEDNEAKEKLSFLLRESVKLEMISDVPLGAFLSGGIDSSAIVALMSGITDQPVKTFSMGFEEEYYNELPNAKLISETFNTDHFEHMVRPVSMDFVEEILSFFDQPFADSSAIPTYLVSQFAREKVKVVLSGDGGDELFAGYSSYKADRIHSLYNLLPFYLREKLIPFIMNKIPITQNSHAKVQHLKKIIKMASLSPEYGHIFWLNIFTEDTKRDLYNCDFLRSLLNIDSCDHYIKYFKRYDIKDFINSCTFVDMKTVLPNDYLVKVDRMSMANSLEVRVPFLDHKLLEFAVSLPSSFKLRNFTSKYLLKNVMKGILPGEIIKGRKKGFSVPLTKWFKTGFKDFINEYLSENVINKRGYFHYGFINTITYEHCNGIKDNSRLLWNLICFEVWHRKFID